MADNPLHDTVIQDGKPLPMEPAEVRRNVRRMFEEGDLVAAIVTLPNGDLAVQVFGPPSIALVETLEEAARSFRTAVERANGIDAAGYGRVL